jgi:hypothetical protein
LGPRDGFADAVALLHMALREDLGVDPPISDLDDQIAGLAALRAVH